MNRESVFRRVALVWILFAGCSDEEKAPSADPDSMAVPVLGPTRGFVLTTATEGVPHSAVLSADESAFYVVGEEAAGETRWRIEKRRTQDGALFAEFGSLGVVAGATAGVARGSALGLDALYVVGSEQIAGSTQWRIEKRRMSDGQLVIPFASSASTVAGSAVAAVASTDSLYVAGYEIVSGVRQWRMERRELQTGELLGSILGVVGEPRAMAVHSSGLYVVGFVARTGGKSGWWVEKRALTLEGNPLFLQSYEVGQGQDEAMAIAVDSTAIYVAGYYSFQQASVFRSQWLVIKWSHLGVLQGGYSWGVIALYDRSSSAEAGPGSFPTALALEGDDLFVFGTYKFGLLPRTSYPRLERRRRDTVELLETVESDSSTVTSTFLMDAEAFYFVGTELIEGGISDPPVLANRWKIEKRIR